MIALIPDGYAERGNLWFLLGAAAIALGYVALELTRRRTTVRFTNLALLDSVAPKRPGWRRHIAAAAFTLALALMVIAFARPANEVEVPKERATIVLAIDTSLSMEADDIRPSRIDAAKTAAAQFVESLPPQFNLGLVSFDGIARVRVTPTTDRVAVLNAIENLDLGEATAIGEAIFAGIDAVDTAPIVDAGGEPIPAVMVLMTDGDTTIGRTDEDGAAAAAERGIPISTIAFGTSNGSVIIEGELQPVPVEESSLQAIADETGGRFFRAESLDELQSVYADIGSSIGFETELQEQTHRYVGFALVALALSAVLSLVFAQRLP